LVWAALTLVQNWLAAGKPSFRGRPLGSFEAWSRTVGGILQTAGITGFLENQNEFYETADEDSLAARCFVRGWWESHQTQPVLAADLVSLAKDCELLSSQTDDPGLARKLGRWLTRNEGRVFDSYRITRAGVQHRAILWRLVRVDGTLRAGGDGDLNEGDSDSVPAFTRGGTNSQNSQNSPAGADEIRADENRQSEFGEFCEFLSPRQKEGLTSAGDTADSRVADVNIGITRACVSSGDNTWPADENRGADEIPADENRGADENRADEIPADKNQGADENRLGEGERQLLAWLRQHGGTATVREIRRGLRAMQRPGVAEAILERFSQLGLGQWEPATAGRRGRVARRFRLTQAAAEPATAHGQEAGLTAEPATQTEPGTATPTPTPTEVTEPSAEVEPALEPVSELAPLEVLDRAMRLPDKWRDRFWQLLDAAGRCPLPDRAMQAYRQLLAELPRELKPILAAAPSAEPNRPDNAVIVAMMAKLSPELQRRFWQIYDSYAGKYPRKELPWLAWQELQREIGESTNPDMP
jgi:hypothetical protein